MSRAVSEDVPPAINLSETDFFVKLGKILEPLYSGTVTQIMKLGGFKLKYMIKNGEKLPEILSHQPGHDQALHEGQPFRQEAGSQNW